MTITDPAHAVPACAGAPARTSPIPRAQGWICILGLVVSLAALFYPTFLSLGERIPGNYDDARLNNVSLEHSYLWLVGRPDHRAFWSPPFGYPARNMAATTETLVGAAPFYWLWRALGTPSDIAFELWLLTMVGLDFFACRGLLRRSLGVNELAATAGAALFCAAAAHGRQMGHAQLLPQFYSQWALSALVRLGQEPPPRFPGRLWVLATAALVAQLWAAFYVAWFLALALLVALVWGLALRPSRLVLQRVLVRDWLPILGCALAAGLTMLPLIQHSQEAAEAIGWRTRDLILASVPHLHTWLVLASGSLLPPHVRPGAPFTAPIPWSPAIILAIFLLGGVVLAGFWRARTHAWIPAIAGASLTLIVLATHWPGGASAWTLLSWFPGWGAIRAVWRVSTVLLIPAALGIASAIDALRRRTAALALALVLLRTQGTKINWYSRAESRRRIAQVTVAVASHCRVFYALRVVKEPSGPLRNSASAIANLDAMEAETFNGIPTMNSYFSQGTVNEGDEQGFRSRLRLWLRDRGIALDSDCVVLVR